MRFLSWGFAVLLFALAVSSCASLPVDFAKANRITAAHATLVSKLGPVSLLRTSSFAVLEAAGEPRFSGGGTYTSQHYSSIEIVASDRLVQSGFEESHALMLAETISRSQRHLERYLMKPAPIRLSRIILTAPDELIKSHATSLSISRQHKFNLAFRYSIVDVDSSNRRIARTLSHEIFHAAIGIYGRARHTSKEMEERAAYMLEYCIEMDTFGSIVSAGNANPPLPGQRASALPGSSDAQALTPTLLGNACRTRIAEVARWIPHDASSR